VPSGELDLSDRKTKYGVIPLTVPAFGAVEAHICLFDFPSDVKAPVQLKIVATDVFKHRHRLNCVIEKNG
jgi:hypothetical protein